MNAEVFPRLIRVMQEQHLDALLAVSPENVTYMAGFPLLALGDPRWRQAAALTTWDGRTALLCADGHGQEARRRVGAETVLRTWGEFRDNPIHSLADLLTEFHLSQSRIGIELDCLAASDFRVLATRFPKVIWAPAEGLFARLRRLKGPGEVERLRRLSRIADRAILDLLASGKRTGTQREVRALVAQRVLELGAEECRVSVTSAEAPEPGGVLGVEVTALLEGYHAVIGRTLASNLPSADRRRWEALLAAHRELVAALGPGGGDADLFSPVQRLQTTLGLPGESLVAHGIGLATVEEPFLGPFPEVRVEAGMVLAVGVPGPGPWPLRDMVLVTSDGTELLTGESHPDRFLG